MFNPRQLLMLLMALVICTPAYNQCVTSYSLSFGSYTPSDCDDGVTSFDVAYSTENKVGNSCFTAFWYDATTGMRDSIQVTGISEDGTIQLTNLMCDMPILFLPTSSINCNGNVCADTIKFSSVNDFLGLLPIEMVDFKGKVRDNGDVILSWTTLTEVNNAYFEIERSTTNEEWELVGRLNGQGTSNQSTFYNYVDRSANSSLVYYRITDVDTDGLRNRNESIAVFRSDTETALFPNPATESFFLSNLDPGNIVKVYSIDQKEIRKYTVAGNQSVTEIDIADLDSGIYFVYIDGGPAKQLTKKFIKR